MSTDTGPGPRLYDLLPVLYRRRDADQGLQLEALLAVVEEQRAIVRDAIEQQYDDWFVETCQEWLLPYLGALVGYDLLPGQDEALARQDQESARLIAAVAPRRDVARTIANRRRKGTLAVLEDLARDVASWPARAVEFRRSLGFDQPVRRYADYPADASARLRRGRLADLRDGEALDLLDGPFDRIAHLVDVRRIDSRHAPGGRYGLPSVGLFVWRLAAYSLTRAPAFCQDRDRGHYTFSILGNDTPLVTLPVREPAPTHVADETNVPAFIRRRAFEERMAQYYGPGKSLCIWLGDGGPVPLSSIVAADLSGWRYTPARGQVAVDPVLGRIAFAHRSAPDTGVWVSYHHAFSADIGGGEYPIPATPAEHVYRVGEGEQFDRLMDAVDRWRTDKAADPKRREAVIELVGSVAFQEQIEIRLDRGDRLTVRAAPHSRPVLRLLDWYSNRPDALRIVGTGEGESGDRLPTVELVGLLVTGRSVRVQGAGRPGGAAALHAGPWLGAGRGLHLPAPAGAEPGALEHPCLPGGRAQHPRHDRGRGGRGGPRPEPGVPVRLGARRDIERPAGVLRARRHLRVRGVFCAALHGVGGGAHARGRAGGEQHPGRAGRGHQPARRLRPVLLPAPGRAGTAAIPLRACPLR